MSLPPEKVQKTFEDVDFLAGDLFGPADRYRLFREKVLPALRAAREALAGLYCRDNGRPGIEPVLLAGVTLLQFMERAPDRKAAERVRTDLGWKLALDLEIGYRGFDPTCLHYFRERLLAGGRERAVLDAVLTALREAGLVKRRSPQRLDSTHVVGLVAEMSRGEVVRQTIRLALEAVAGSGVSERPENWGVLWERYVEMEIDWRRQTKEELTAKFAQAGRDGLGLAAWLGEQPELRGHEKALLLERVLREQYEITAAGPHPRKAEVAGGVKNPHDPEAQWAAKDPAQETAWVGYKAQVMETVGETTEARRKGEPTEQFVTEITTTEAIASDFDGMDRALGAQAQQGQEAPPALYVDAGYVSGETLAEAKTQGRELRGPARPCPSREGGLEADQFDVDVAARRAVCPAGKTSTQCSLIHDAHQQTAYYRFEWGAQCDDCRLRKSCTKSRSGRRTLCVGEHHDRVQARRREMKTDAFAQEMHRRNAIEGTISELVRLGLRRSRYRGLAKTRLANYVLAAACNARRWLRLLAWRIGPAGAMA